MNIQLGNIASKAEFDVTSSKKIISNANAVDSAVNEPAFDEHALSTQKEMDENSAQLINEDSIDDDTGDEFLLIEPVEVSPEQPANHPLLNSIGQYKSSGLNTLNEIPSQIAESENSTAILDEPLIEQANLPETPVNKKVATASLINEQAINSALNSTKSQSAPATVQVNLNAEQSNAVLNNGFNVGNLDTAAQIINTELNTVTKNNNLQHSGIALQSLQGLLRPSSIQPTVNGKVNSVDTNISEVPTHKSDLHKHTLNALPNSFSIESRDLLTQKAAVLNPFAHNESLADTFQWRQEKLKGGPNEWGQRLLNVLGDKVNLQIGQQLQKAQIRLDPPNLGRIDISISVDGDKTSVSLITSNPQVRDAIAQTLDQLRQTLSQNGSVSVDLNFDDKQQEQQHSNSDEKVAENISLVDNTEQDDELRQTVSSGWLNKLV